MPSIYKNADKNAILDALISLSRESFPFQQPILQNDTFCICCNCRRYWGKYTYALFDAGIKLSNQSNVRSELGYEIDWWNFRFVHN